MARSKRIPIIMALFSLGTVLAVLTISYPQILSGNAMLKNFVTHEILVFLVVPLTVTFASVASMHLQLSSMIRSLSKPEARRRLEEKFGTPLRNELNSSAWVLFWAFVIGLVAVIVKGQFGANVFVVSGVHAVAIVVVVINVIVLYDVHKAIFTIAPVLTGRSADAETDQP